MLDRPPPGRGYVHPKKEDRHGGDARESIREPLVRPFRVFRRATKMNTPWFGCGAREPSQRARFEPELGVLHYAQWGGDGCSFLL